MDLTIQAVSGLISTTGFAMLLDKIRAAAAARLGCEPAQIEITNGYAGIQHGRSVALAELAEDGLKADASFANRDRYTYAYGTAAAHMAVDPGTGR
jgi:carbon-monoxide dehydrogenase large subunit